MEQVHVLRGVASQVLNIGKMGDYQLTAQLNEQENEAGTDIITYTM
jgi:hypothetical protein